MNTITAGERVRFRHGAGHLEGVVRAIRDDGKAEVAVGEGEAERTFVRAVAFLEPVTPPPAKPSKKRRPTPTTA